MNDLGLFESANFQAVRFICSDMAIRQGTAIASSETKIVPTPALILHRREPPQAVPPSMQSPEINILFGIHSAILPECSPVATP